MESKLLELELHEINEDHALYERAHANLIKLTIGLAIGVALALIAVPMLLMWPRGSARIVPSSMWPMLALAAFWVALTIGAYIQRQRAFRRVREACLKLRRAGYHVTRQDVHFSGSVFGISELAAERNSHDSNGNGNGRGKPLDVNRLSARSLHTVME
ncbi:MAG TPA: hypothetical protein VJO99_04540 [Burkholderiaceae bacterium]|nr:hypothetical protein [Burkholderiaceae bacterium]